MKNGVVVNPCDGVFVPKPDETPVPCPNGYLSTDCVYLSDRIKCGSFQLMPNDELTKLLNCIIQEFDKQAKELSLLKRELNKLK